MGRGCNGRGGGPRSGSGSSGVGVGSQGEGGGGGRGPGANDVIPFSLTPACTVPDVIDYTIANGIKLYTKVTANLEKCFDMEAQSIESFLAQEEDHIYVANWDNAIKIYDSSGNSFNLVTHYGKLLIKECKNYVITNLNDKANCQSQNPIQMYVFLRDYLTADVLSKVII